MSMIHLSLKVNDLLFRQQYQPEIIGILAWVRKSTAKNDLQGGTNYSTIGID